MGQVLQQDRSPQLSLNPAPLNSAPQKHYTTLLTAKGVESPFLEKIFQHETYKRIEVTYKFNTNLFIHLELSKEKAKQQPGYELSYGKQMIYGYKFKKNQKSERIRSDKVYFRRKIFVPVQAPPTQPKSSYRDKMKNTIRGRSKEEENNGRREGKSRGKDTEKQKQQDKEELMRKLAELKMLARLDLGAKLGRMVDGTDGTLTQSYIEFYSEVTIEQSVMEERQQLQKEKLCDKLVKKGLRVQINHVEMAYSVFQRGYILRQIKKGPDRQQQSNGEAHSIAFLMKEFEKQINRAIHKLDGLTNMLSAIQNHLNHRDIEKAMEKFEQNMAGMEQAERIVYAQQMAYVLSKYNYYKSYQRQVSSYSISSRSDSMAQSRNNSRASRFTIRSPKSEHPEDSTQSYDFGKSDSPRSNLPLRFSEAQSAKKDLYAISTQDFSQGSPLLSNKTSIGNAESKQGMWELAVERLRVSMVENDKPGVAESMTCLKNLGMVSSMEVQLLYGQMLMENARTRHAKLIFEKLLYAKRGTGNDFLCAQIFCMLGCLAHAKGSLSQARMNYQRSLSLRLNLRHHCRRTAILLNNIAVLDYLRQDHSKSMLNMGRALRVGDYCPDYEMLMRSNHAMGLAAQGMLKQAKLEMYKTYKNIEPNSNMQIVCKFFSNLGYFDLLDNLPDKAKANLQNACQIEEKYLLPNGYKPSLVMHNNYSMYHLKRGEWRKAAVQMDKVESQLDEVAGIKAVQIHFNFARIYKQLYNHDAACKHLNECRSALMKLPERTIQMYKEKIEAEIQRLEALRIDEVTEEQSYKWSRISRSAISKVH